MAHSNNHGNKEPKLPKVTDAEEAKKATDAMAPYVPGGAAVKAHRNRTKRRLQAIDDM